MVVAIVGGRELELAVGAHVQPLAAHVLAREVTREQLPQRTSGGIGAVAQVRCAVPGAMGSGLR